MDNQKLIDDLQKENLKLKDQIIELNSVIANRDREKAQSFIDLSKKVSDLKTIIESNQEDIEFLTDEIEKRNLENKALRKKIVKLKLVAATIKQMSLDVIDKILKNFLDEKDLQDL